MIELISEKERKLITEYIETYGPIEDDFPDHPMASFETVFKEWDKKKQNLFKMLGNNLIVKRPYTYTIPQDNLVIEIINHTNEPAYDNFRAWWHREIVASLSYEYEELYDLLNKIIKPSYLAENRWPGETKVYTFPDGETFKVSKGMRPMKIFSKVVEKYNGPKQEFEDFRIWHSQMLNTRYIDGELCLSIHPLDYMTMSDNDNNWDSCMNWMNPGDYRCGTLECMNSPYIVIAYLHNPNHPFRIRMRDDWEWNSKRWRELFIVRPDVISEIKGYCFQDENLTNSCLMWIKELAANNLGWTYDNDEVNVASAIPFDNTHDLYINFYQDTYMYNDLGTLDKHRGRVNREKIGKYKDKREWEDGVQHLHYGIDVPIGGRATCVWCGRDIEDRDRDNAVMCFRCDNSRYCAYCGEYISNRELYYIDDLEDPICYGCYEYECSVDDLTNEVHLTSNMSYIYFRFDDGSFSHDSMCVYMPEDNDAYLNCFSGRPLVYHENYIYRQYITKDMVINKDMFSCIFDIDLDEI